MTAVVVPPQHPFAPLPVLLRLVVADDAAGVVGRLLLRFTGGATAAALDERKAVDALAEDGHYAASRGGSGLTGCRVCVQRGGSYPERRGSGAAEADGVELVGRDLPVDAPAALSEHGRDLVDGQ
jgi:hypothetical protein